ncbi:hypothetical protein V1478_009160 [Vespula squamosa]|uniref:Polyprotein n=1 Tax=Vespula squamosa TaxID=30214 RepID=A0ABD2ANU5_VESSQ
MIPKKKLTQKFTADSKINHASQHTETPREKQYYSVREAAECIMVFDGSNENAKSFIRACENARGLVHPTDIPYLSRIIRSRIRGDADIYLSYVDTDFDEIIHEIKQIYVLPQRKRKWRNELAFVKQESYETPLQYGLRIEKMVKHVKEKIRENNNPEIAISLIQDLEDTVLDSFVAGLKNKELENKVNYTRPKSLLEAIGNTRIIWDCIKHKRVTFSLNFNDVYRSSDRLRRTYYDYPYRTNHDEENFMPTYATNRSQSYSNVDTYTDRQRQYKTNNVEYEYLPDDASDSHYAHGQNKIVFPDIFCEYCKHSGHVIEECRAFIISRQYCERCEIRGHNLNECHRIQKPSNIQSDDYPFIHGRVYTFYHREQVVGEYKTLTMKIKNTVNTTEFFIDTFAN